MDAMVDDLVACLHDERALAEDCVRHLAGPQPDEPLRLAVCGVYNAGKSSLLNALTGRFGSRGEAFRTGAARVTSQVSELRAGQIVYVDTPGIDGGALDDVMALTCVERADCVLYAHRLSVVEFDQQERAWLQGLAMRLEDAPTRLALVITQIDEVIVDEEASQRRHEIVAAFRLAVGFDPVRTFTVSSSRFTKGVDEDKRAMVALSGIPALSGWLEACAADAALCAAFGRQRRAVEGAALRERVRNVAVRVQAEHDACVAEFNARAGAFETAASRLAAKVREAVQRLDSLGAAGASAEDGL